MDDMNRKYDANYLRTQKIVNTITINECKMRHPGSEDHYRAENERLRAELARLDEEAAPIEAALEERWARLAIANRGD